MEWMTPETVFHAASLVLTMGTAVWHMSLKLEKTTTIVETNMALVTTKISSIEKDIASLEEQIRESRTGRVELWKEVNVLRERAAMIEVAQKKEC